MVNRTVKHSICPTPTGSVFDRSHYWKPVEGATYSQWIRPRKKFAGQFSLRWQLFKCEKCGMYAMLLSSAQLEEMSWCTTHRGHYSYRIRPTMNGKRNADKLSKRAKPKTRNVVSV